MFSVVRDEAADATVFGVREVADSLGGLATRVVREWRELFYRELFRHVVAGPSRFRSV